MFYRELPPAEPLRRWVHAYWILIDEAPAADRPERVLPDGRAELLFDFAAPYRWAGHDQDPPGARLVGQLEGHIDLVPTGEVAVLGVRLEPAALLRLVGTSARELTGRAAALEELELFGLAALEERLRALASWDQRLALLERTLAQHLLPPGPRDALAEEAALYLRRSGGRPDVAAVARRFGASVRTLERRFARAVGLPPKLYARQMRLQRVLALLQDRAAVHWSEVAHDAGCFDQAHLIREFRQLAGESPGSFLRAEHELAGHLTGLRTG